MNRLHPLSATFRTKVRYMDDTQLLNALDRLGPAWLEPTDEGYGFEVHLEGLDVERSDFDFKTQGLSLRDAIRATVLVDAAIMGEPEEL